MIQTLTLHQIACPIGPLQFRALRRELVDSGRMAERASLILGSDQRDTIQTLVQRMSIVENTP